MPWACYPVLLFFNFPTLPTSFERYATYSPLYKFIKMTRNFYFLSFAIYLKGIRIRPVLKFAQPGVGENGYARFGFKPIFSNF